MGLIGKLIKRGAADVDFDDEDGDDLDLEVEDEPVDSESEEGGLKAGLMGRLRGLRNRKGSDDDEDDDDWDPKDLLREEDKISETGSGQVDGADAAEEPGEDEDLPEVQVVRLEGVPDVRVEGDSSGASAPSVPQAGNAPSSGGQSGGDGGNGTASGEASPAQAAGNAGPPTDNQGVSKGEGVGISLMDIFEEEIEVDETLKDLAESIEDDPAQELADDLRDFFEELEASMQ